MRLFRSVAVCGLCMLGSQGVAWAQAGGLRTSFEFSVAAPSGGAGDVARLGGRASRFDLAEAWRELHRDSQGLSILVPGAEFVSGAGPLSLANESARTGRWGASVAPFALDADRYRLESARVTLRAPVYEDESWTVRLGATGVSAHAASASSGAAGLLVTGLRPGLGLVPMWHASAERRLTDRWSLIGDLNVGTGRSLLNGQPIDMALRAAYDWDRDWSLSGGYRLVDTRNGSLPGLTGLGGVNRIQTLTFGVRRSF